MRPRIFTSILLFISAYSPLFFIFVVKDFEFETGKFYHPKASIIAIAIIALSVVLLFAVMAKLPRGNKVIQIISVKDRSVDVINYTIPYMISFFGIDLSRPADMIAVSLFLIILLILTITSKSVFINPILAIAGYHLFDVEYKFDGTRHSTVVISKEEITRGMKCRVLMLTRFLYLVRKEGEET